MTAADFVAASVWPLAILFAVLLKTVRDWLLWRSILLAGVALIFLYLVLYFAYGESSLIAIVDGYLAVAAFGAGLLWVGLRRMRAFPRDSRAWFTILAGTLLVSLPGIIVIPDFMQPRIVLEGRVENLRIEGYRSRHHVADIAGHSVNVTTPVYDRFKSLPAVRVEVGQGSGYVFKIEYLSN